MNIKNYIEKKTKLVNVDCPLTHTFSEGVYHREIFMPKGTFIIGHKHNTTHLNIISKGKAKVWMDGIVEVIEAPYTFESKAGVRKILFIEEDMLWATVHVTSETDIETLENMLVDKHSADTLTLDDIKKIVKEDLLCQWHG